MKDDKALIADLKAERAALVSELKEERKRFKALEERAKGSDAEMKKRLKRIAAKEREAADLERAAQTRFALELKELKLFSDRIKRLTESGEPIVKKSELIDLFKDFLKNIDKKTAIVTAKKISETIKKEEETDSFDLDDILSSDGELDLKKLCEDLGVYQGDDGN